MSHHCLLWEICAASVACHSKFGMSAACWAIPGRVGAPRCHVHGTTCQPRRGTRTQSARQCGCRCKTCKFENLSRECWWMHRPFSLTNKQAGKVLFVSLLGVYPAIMSHWFRMGRKRLEKNRSPELLDKPVVQLFLPLCFQESSDCFAPREELLTNVPLTICKADSTASIYNV